MSGGSFSRSDVSFESAGARCAAWLYRPVGPPPFACVVPVPRIAPPFQMSEPFTVTEPVPFSTAEEERVSDEFSIDGREISISPPVMRNAS
mgnify:CR=1 FL=1